MATADGRPCGPPADSGEADPRTVARLHVINEVSAATLERLDPADIYRVVAESIDRHFSYFQASVFAVDGEGSQAVLVAQSPPREPLGYTQSLDVGLVGAAARQGHSLLVNDVAGDPRYVPPAVEREPAASELCSPVFEDGAVVAVVDVECTETGAFDDSDRLALEAIANVVGLALHAAGMHGEVERQLERLRETQCQLLHSERLADVGRLTARVAHEIRNPLTTIGGFARRILKRAADPECQRYAAILVEEVSRLERLLAGIMDFVRPGEPRKQAAVLPAVIERALALTEAAREGKHITVERDLQPDLPPFWADPGQLEQVLINLLQNACDAIAETGTVAVSALRRGDEIVVRIIDTGCGISASQLEHVFDPFFTTKAGGNGLGLAVASKIIEDHGGHILIGSEPGTGTHVTLRLPLGQSPPSVAGASGGEDGLTQRLKDAKKPRRAEKGG
ncbi:MAG: ATP-binding protein [Planctomycetota bacterium]